MRIGRESLCYLGDGLASYVVKGEDFGLGLAVHRQSGLGGHVQTHPSLQVRVQVGVGRSDSHKDLDALSAGTKSFNA